MIEQFLTTITGKIITTPWYCYLSGIDKEGLTERIHLIRKLFMKEIHRKVSRVGRLAKTEQPDFPGLVRGFFGFFTDYGHVYISESSRFGGQRRMRNDRNAPSRSYLKIEEAYKILKITPKSGELVVDLGAAPGGWSYSAARHGARVIAIDNGDLKGGALNHPLIDHYREDAWTFVPVSQHKVDWLFCDMIDDPYEVVGLIRRWLENQWCRHFVFNAKFGRTDPLRLIAHITSSDKGLQPFSQNLIIRHLYHDRDELTVMGSVLD
jgi:23S rRNA (cytidine2498-2'-O)-methyltransferase